MLEHKTPHDTDTEADLKNPHALFLPFYITAKAMSWFFKSLQSDDSPSPPSSPTHRPAGVKDDLSVLGDTIGRQLRGVAAFLAPPPSTAPADQQSQPPQQPSDALLGIRNDLAEIGGSFKSGLSMLSGNKAVSEISRFASGFWQFQNQGDHSDDNDDADDDGIPGITEEVVDFVKEISKRPECWTDFPLSLDNDFKMNDSQREHASTIEQLVPMFSALRLQLNSYVGEERFWMIYFILLLPRLNEDDCELLSTPEIVETRDALLQKLNNSRNEPVENNSSADAFQESRKECETLGENIASGPREVTEITNAEIDGEENTEEWLKEPDVPSAPSALVQKKVEHEEEDVSFSDLEDDDSDFSNRLVALKLTQEIKATSTSESNDWVQLNEGSETQSTSQKTGQLNSRDKDSEGESSDWLTVGDSD